MLIPFALALTSLVEGETCPEPPDVERRVRAILHLAEEQVLSEGFIVERREAGLFVELRSAESASIGERLLPSDGTCEELAQAAAVVLSAWLSDVHPDFAPELPAEPIALPPPVVASPLVAPPERPAENRASQPTAARQGATSRRRVELDLGIGVGVSDGALAGVGSLSGAYTPKGGWGVRATVLVDTTRRAALGSGFVNWRRWPLALGPTWRSGGDALALDVSLAPALSWLRVAGSEFEPDKTQSGLTWAGIFDARLASRRRVGWFVAAHGQVYFAESSVYAGDAEDALPPFVFSVLVGARLAP